MTIFFWQNVKVDFYGIKIYLNSILYKVTCTYSVIVLKILRLQNKFMNLGHTKINCTVSVHL